MMLRVVKIGGHVIDSPGLMGRIVPDGTASVSHFPRQTIQGPRLRP